MDDRRGFTLVETIVALLLLQVALFALLAVAGVAARDHAEGAIGRRALATARRRAEELRTVACAGGGGGSLVARGLTESWRIEGVGVARTVVDSVSAMSPRGGRVVRVARSWVLCGP